jgi:hypothetical protein
VVNLGKDAEHTFSNIIDNYADEAVSFKIPTRGAGGKVIRQSELRQIEGPLNGKDGVFEWIVDNGEVTHRRFIGGGQGDWDPEPEGAMRTQGRSRSLLEILRVRGSDSWPVILVGVRRGWIDPQAAVDFAAQVLGGSAAVEPAASPLVQLAGADDAAASYVDDQLARLAGPLSKGEEVPAVDAWRYAMLKHLRTTTADRTS